MNAAASISTSIASDAARVRLLSRRGEPLAVARWERAVFLHFEVEPGRLLREVPPPFELEFHEGRACVSLVAFTMRRFRPVRRALSGGWLLALIPRQVFLHVRTYVRWGDEPGTLFLWGWLSRPWGLPLPSGSFGLPYAFASLRYAHAPGTGELRGRVSSAVCLGAFAYRAAVESRAPFEPGAAGSLTAFALERYSGFFCRGRDQSVFRVWHPPWLQAELSLLVEDCTLVEQACPWFAGARLIGAQYSPGFESVWLGRAHPLPTGKRQRRRPFLEMP